MSQKSYLDLLYDMMDEQERKEYEEHLNQEADREERECLEENRLPYDESKEWEKWGIEGAQSLSNLITIAKAIELNIPSQNITIKKALHIISLAIKRQLLEYYVKTNDYRIYFKPGCPPDFKSIQYELDIANFYKELIEQNAAFNTYTFQELFEQGFDEKGNLLDNSPFKKDFMQAFHALQAHAEYAATKAYIEIVQKVIQSVPDDDKKKIKCPFIWEQLKKEWESYKKKLI